MKTVSVFILTLMLLLSGCVDKNEKASDLTLYISIELSIEGMSCMSCVSNVRKTLNDLDGVIIEKVSLENNNAIFKYNPRIVSLDEIKKTVNDRGYKAGKSENIIE